MKQATPCSSSLCLVDQIQLRSQLWLLQRIKCLIKFLLESSIISTDSDITHNVIREVINVQYEKWQAKNETLSNSITKCCILIGKPMKNHSKSCITENRWNKAKYLTQNSIWLKFVNKTSLPNPVESLGYIKCYSLSSFRPIKSSNNSIRCNCQKICNWSRRPKTMLEIRKKATFV